MLGGKIETGFIKELENLFLIETRSSILRIEGYLSNLVLLDIIIQAAYTFSIYYFDVVCVNPNTPLVITIAYINLVCSSMIKKKTGYLALQKAVFLIIFLTIFLINKKIINYINRYHVLTLKEELPQYILYPPKDKKNYIYKWSQTIITYFIFKVLSSIILLITLIFALFVQNYFSAISAITKIDDKECGPKLYDDNSSLVNDLPAKYICHYPNEFLIFVTNIFLNIAASIITVLYFVSIFTLIYYVINFAILYKKFKKKNYQTVIIENSELIQELEEKYN
jgi:hypothetical protein